MLDSKKISEILLAQASKEGGEQFVEGLISFLKEKKALHLLPAVSKHLKRNHKDLLYTERAHISSRHALSDEDIARIKKTLDIPSSVLIEYSIDEHLLGGFLVMYNGHIYNGSLQGQVDQLKNILTY